MAQVADKDHSGATQPDPSARRGPASLTFAVEDALRAGVVARLYQIILGRPHDHQGMEAYLALALQGDWRRSVAASLLGSDEHRDARGGAPAASFLCHNARETAPDAGDDAPPALDLALDLEVRLSASGRHNLLHALFPDGVPLDDAALYGWWRRELAACQTRAAGPQRVAAMPLLTLIVPAEDGEAGVALLGDTGGAVEVLIEGPGSIGAARGLFTGFLHPGDVLADDLLAWLGPEIETADVVLTDEDRLSDDGITHPRIGGGWDPEAALAGPPRGLVLIRTTLLRALDAQVETAAASRDWDLLLQAYDLVGGNGIIHRPAPLVHRPRGRAMVEEEAPGPGLVRRHLARTGQASARVEGDGRGRPLRVCYALPKTLPVASVIVPTRDRAGLLTTCLAGLLERTDYPALEVVIVDNDSRDAEALRVLDHARRDPRVKILSQAGSFNWSALNNAGVAAMAGEVAVLLNNDTDVIDPCWLREMVSQALRPPVGMVGAKLLYPDRTVQHAGVGLLPGATSTHLWRHADGVAPGYEDQLRIVRSVATVTGACVAIRRAVFEEVGGLEQDRLEVTWSDTDLCLRVRAAGYRVIWTPHALLYHHELATRGADDQPDNKPRFLREQAYFRAYWGELASADPFASPYLLASDAVPLLSTRFLATPAESLAALPLRHRRARPT